MLDIKDMITHLESLAEKVELPWGASANVPFYVDVRKPRPSMSKHDEYRHTYWDYDDGVYLLTCANEMPRVLEYVRQLEEQVRKS